MSNFILLKSAGLIAMPDYYDEKIFRKIWWQMNHNCFKWEGGW